MQISAQTLGCLLELEVGNTGVWKERERDGVGQGNTRRRLELFHGNQSRFAIIKADGWVRVRMHLPS